MRAPKALWITVGLVEAVWLGAGVGLGGTSGEVAVSQSAHYPEFLLEDPFGRFVSRDDFQGRFLLVLFGFTQCSETCSMTLSEVAEVMDALGEKADQVQPLFISVDPEHDAGLNLARYTAAFHPAILGLTGSPGAIFTAAKTFHIFYDRDFDTTDSDSFDMVHSSGLILLGPDGRWLRTFSYGTSADVISADLSRQLE